LNIIDTPALARRGFILGITLSRKMRDNRRAVANLAISDLPHLFLEWAKSGSSKKMLREANP
jgi:hypothetical protein